ncbi:unnamed protein product [Rotaria magnacalcarata]|uniref:Uncharacterized protein n=1 Tax=Rotaria magnacalcarata TaxID=392030 RepID=A0A820K5T7_9BILA|nr:unnamed protein product [Rotaria magnacalcarata]CAF4336460.1 unnamed protein product [Rotaria magnacalcarata]
MSYFNIGLDSQLSQLNLKEQQERKKLTNYAANDCLSMQRLLIKMQIIITAPTTTTNIHPSNINPENIEPTSSNDTQRESESELEEQRLTTTLSNFITTTTASMYDHDLELISSDENEHHLRQQSQRTIHNRTCTIKQRRRYYQYEITRRNIGRRFSISDIKRILRQNNTLFNLINFSASINPDKTLYIGIRDQTKLQEYNIKTQTLFTTDHYNKLKYERREYRSSDKDDLSMNRRG